jgi:hypothetical protein
MDIFEAGEVRWPQRTAQQDEEEAAAPTAHAALEEPLVQAWMRGLGMSRALSWAAMLRKGRG